MAQQYPSASIHNQANVIQSYVEVVSENPQAWKLGEAIYDYKEHSYICCAILDDGFKI